MLKLFPANMLLDEQAWLFSRVPKHKEALEIIIYRLDDYEMADEYCDLIWKEFQDHLSQSEKQLTQQIALQNSTLSNDMNMQNSQMNYHRSSIVNDLLNANNINSSMNSNNNINNISNNNLNSTMHHTLGKHSTSYQIANFALHNALVDAKWIEARDIYLILLDVYLHPPNAYVGNNQTYMDCALKMLEKNFGRINAIDVFNRLPSAVEISKCVPYMESVLTARFKKKRTNQIIRNLLKQSNLKISNYKITKEQAYQLVDDQTVCKKCKKRIGQSAFLRYPDGNVFHYICVKAAQLNADMTKSYGLF